MRVLILSLFHPELVRGGAQTIAFDVFTDIQESGVAEGTLLCSLDQSYPSLFKSGACVTGFDNRPGQHLFLSQAYDYWWHKNLSVRSVEAFVEFLLLVRPDIIHFHHFFLFGIDLLSVARRALNNVKIVLTFHEFMAICSANGHMVRTFDNTLCARSSAIRCHQCFKDRAPEEFHTRKLWFMSHLEQVDLFTCPSEFMIDIYEEWGLPRTKMKHVSNGIRADIGHKKLPAASSGRRKFGFFGQYVDAKGLTVLLDAIDLLRSEGFIDFSVEFNGGNLKYASEAVRERFEQFIANEQSLTVSDRIAVDNGSYSADDLERRMQRVDWVIVPSTWWEIFCLVISEAWAYGRPVLCSDVGGPKERVQENVDGVFFMMGDPRDLATKIRLCCEDKDLWDRLHAGITHPLTSGAMTSSYIESYQSLLKPDGL